MNKNNKGKKKVFLILGLIILFVFIGALLCLYFYHNYQKENEQSSQLVIVDKKNFNDYEYKEIFKDYIFVVKNNSLGAIDKEGNVVIDFIYESGSYISLDKNAVVINSDDKYYLYDDKLNLIFTSDDYIQIVPDLESDEVYYYNNDGLYNLNKEKVYSDIEGYFVKAGKYIFADQNIIDMDSKNKTPINYFITNNSLIYALAKNEKDLYIYDLKEATLKVYQINESFTNGFSLKDSLGNTYSYTEAYGLVNSNKVLKVNDYEFRFQDCSYGFKVYDKKGKALSDICFESYNVIDESNIADNKANKALDLLKENDNYLLINGKIRKSSNNTFVVGSYLVSYEELENLEQSKITLKDLNGKVIDNNPCSFNIQYLGDDIYYCDDGGSKFLVNEKLNKITESYEDLNCLNNSNYCIFNKNYQYGLLYKDEVVIPSVYDKMVISNDGTKIIGESLWDFVIYYFDKAPKALNKKDLEVNLYKPYKNINTEDVITEYDLSWMSETIKNNEELFKKYAYIVEGNDKLGTYKNKVMDLFYEIALNKNYLAENNLLKSLKQLKIIRKDTLEEEGYSGLYYDDDKRIEVITDEDNVLYHELTHFADFSFNINPSHNVYKCGNKYLSNNAFVHLNVTESNNCELVSMEEPNFITEGGSEYFSSYYLNHHILRAYKLQTNVIGALVYLYGFDTLKEIFFSEEGSYKLFMLFKEAGITPDDYSKLLTITNRFHTVTNEDKFVVADILIKMYEDKKDSPWYEDKEFSEIISLIINFSSINSNYTSRYNEYLHLNYDFPSKYRSLLNDEVDDLINVIPGYMKTDEGSYLIFNLIDKDANYYYKVVKYDFINNKTLDEEVINY